MLAYLTDEQPTSCEQEAFDVTPAVPTPDDRGVWTQVAYEVAQQLDGVRWIPARRRRAETCRYERLDVTPIPCAALDGTRAHVS